MEVKPTHKRRYPRRAFNSHVGVLIQGKYFVQNIFELGEKGMMFDTELALSELDKLVCTFYLPDGYFVITQAIIRYTSRDEKTKLIKVGVEFSNISFDARRKVRDFIAQRKDKAPEFKLHQQ